MTEIGLVAHQFEVFVLQEFISGKPGDIATAALFKYLHSFTGSTSRFWEGLMSFGAFWSGWMLPTRNHLFNMQKAYLYDGTIGCLKAGIFLNASIPAL